METRCHQELKEFLILYPVFFENFDWTVVVDGLFNFIEGFDWNGVSESIFNALGSAFASFINLGMILGEKINEAIDEAGNFFQ